MTSAAGYRRLNPSSDTLQARIWAWMRTRRKPWTAIACADAVGASERLVRRYVMRLAEAGYLAQQGEDGSDSGRIPARLWLLARDTGPIAPVLVGGAAGSEIEDLNSDLTGPQLARIRVASGLSMGQFASDVLGIRDRRTMRRYEQAEIVPTPAAIKARAYVRQNKLRTV